jgi:hypothetical protein
MFRCERRGGSLAGSVGWRQAQWLNGRDAANSRQIGRRTVANLTTEQVEYVEWLATAFASKAAMGKIDYQTIAAICASWRAQRAVVEAAREYLDCEQDAEDASHVSLKAYNAVIAHKSAIAQRLCAALAAVEGGEGK